MKKIYVLALALLFVGAAIGQNIVTYPAGKVLDQKQISKIKIGQNNSNTKASERWYNYGDAMDLIAGGIGELNANMLFPDSTISVLYTGGVLGGPWIHKLADVFDPAAYMFNDVALFPGEMALLKNSTYTLDSIQIYCIYMRGYKTPTATDTLIFDVAIIDNPSVAGGFSYFGPTSGVSLALQTDTTKFVDVLYTQSTNSFGMNPHTTYKVPLTDLTANDTLANGLNVITAVPNLSIAANKIVAVSVSFQPGYTWTFMDTLNSYNRFRFLSLNEGPTAFPAYTKGDWNVSYILPQDVRYNLAASWNGSYIPSFAYMSGTANDYDYIHHTIYYKCTGVSDFSTTSIQENNASDNMLGNAYPNPVNGNTEVIIPVNTNDANASLVISNVVGQQIMKINTIQNGKVVLNTSKLNAGLYFYTLNSGKNTITKKLTVIK
jgi:hypothetical protein